MKKVKRSGVFETNSSAVHSLTVTSDGLEPSKLPMDEDGYIIAKFGNFGEYDEGITTYDQEVKLSYVLTELYYLNNWDRNLEDNYQYQCFRDAICKYSGAKGIRIREFPDPELNHQVIPEYEPKFCDCYYEESVINFIFNKYVGIKMSHD